MNNKYWTKLIILISIFSNIVFSSFGQYRIFTIGDSTVQDYNEGYSPRKGWGQMLPFFFNLADIDVINAAVGGTSSKSFYNDLWEPVRDQLRSGDVIFIQFGINDRNSGDPNRYAPYEEFKEYIRMFVAETRSAGAFPVLVSTVRRNAWTAEGLPYDAYHEHPVAMRELAVELETPLVDLNQYCYDLFLEQGELYTTRFLTMNLVGGEYPNYTNGNNDNVHYQQIGAIDMARKVCEVIANSTYPELQNIVPYLKPQYPVSISVNDPSKDQATVRTATFPSGIEVTLKTLPENGANFLDWVDGNGVISDNSLYTFIMGDQAMEIQARYETDIVSEIIINNNTQSLIAPVASGYQWYYNNNEIAGATSSIYRITNSGTYSVRLLGNNGETISILSICVSIGNNGTIRRIFIIGDSTVCDYRDSNFPMAGWGQVLGYFFNDNIEIYNHAIGGRSSRSFIEQGRWTTVYNELQPGDYVFVQFGHNDRDYSRPERYTSVPDYKVYITQYVEESLEKGAIPVLVSPMVMNAWNTGGMRNVFTETGNDYRGAMEEVALEYDVTFVDLNMMSYNYFSQFNHDYCSRFFYNTYPAGEYPNYPDGSNDGTHFQEIGAVLLADMIIEGISESNNQFACALNNYIKTQYSVNVASNIPNPGSITQTMTVPEGCPITAKVLPSAGNTFNYWAENGVNSETSTIYRFIMPNSAIGLTALFNGGEIGTATIEITAPTNNVTYPVNSNIELSAIASTENDFISKVEFYSNDILLGEDEISPYTFTWSDVEVGTYTIKAQAVDNLGVTAISEEVIIYVSDNTDCAGVFNGTASFDDCGVCSGGNTGISPCLGAIQAENYCEIDGVVESQHAGFSGTGYINFDNVIGSSGTWNLFSLIEGEVTLSFVCANGGIAARSMSVSVNGQDQAVLTGAATGAWTNYDMENVTLNLSAGINTIVLTATSEEGGPNLDAIFINDEGLSVIGCDVQSIRLNAGWNIVGYPFQDSADLETALSNILPYVEVVKDMAEFYVSDQQPFLNSLQQLQWSHGYFIKVSQDCVLIWE